MPFESEWDVKALFNRSTIYIVPLSEGAPWRCRLGCEHDTLRLLLLRPYAGTQPIRTTCTPFFFRSLVTALAPPQISQACKEGKECNNHEALSLDHILDLASKPSQNSHCWFIEATGPSQVAERYGVFEIFRPATNWRLMTKRLTTPNRKEWKKNPQPNLKKSAYSTKVFLAFRHKFCFKRLKH